MDLLAAISQAGGVTQAGLNHVEIVRRYQNEEMVIQANLEQVLQGNEPNVNVLPRDAIYVKSHSDQIIARLVGTKFSVLGEVERPGSYVIESTMDLLTAVSLGGGITKFGSNRIEIIRDQGQEKATIRANLDRILEGKDPNIEILPHDTIYVRRRIF